MRDQSFFFATFATAATMLGVAVVSNGCEELRVMTSEESAVSAHEKPDPFSDGFNEEFQRHMDRQDPNYRKRLREGD